MGMESAELGAESALFHVRGGNKEIDAVRIGRQSAAGELGGDSRGDPVVPQPCSLRACVRGRLEKFRCPLTLPVVSP